MRRFILLALFGILLMKNVTLSKNQGYPSRLAWLFGLNNTQHETKERNETNDENKPTVCQSQECKKIAQIITESMDKSMDPCDDFYKYACGKWSEHNPTPKGMKSWSMFVSAQVNVIKKIKEIFDEGPKKDDLLAVKLAKKWYAVCMDTDAMDSQGLEPLVFTLSRIGGWPMIMEPDEWNEEEYSWQKVDDQYVRLIGKNAFHDVRVNENRSSNESQKIVHVSIPHLPPASFKLWDGVDSEEEGDESDEDLSDEEKQSDEQNDSQEPGSEDQDDNQNDSTNNNGNEDDDNNDGDKDSDNNDDKNDDEEDDNNDTNKQDDDDNNDTHEHDDYEENKKSMMKKRINVKKAGKFAKNKKLEHSRKIKSINSKKHENHKMKKDRIKRRVIPNVHEKLRTRKIEKNHVKQARKERVKKTLKATTSQISTEETTDKSDVMKLYANYISKVARAIAEVRGVEVSEEHLNKDIQDMIKFHIKLIEITTEGGKEKELTLNDFQEWYERKMPKTSNSAIDWLYKIGELFDEAHVPVSGDMDIKISKPDYFSCLVSLLDETSSRTIVNYIHWNFLSRIIRTTTIEMRKLYNAWEEKEKNDQILGIPARSFKCTREVEMSDMLAYEYVRKHFSEEIMTAASDMMDDIQKEVEYQIKDSDWVDEDTKDFVLAKLVHMEKFIGYPNWYRNNSIVKRYYQGLIIGNSYYENTLSYDRYSKWKELRKLLKEDEDDEIMTINPVLVNAFFSPDLNSVALSAADFQSPLFAFGRPQAINYGIVGTIMGHEVNHGFDNSGHLYNKKGKIVEWLSAMAEAYGKRVECFVEQFNNYAINEMSNTIKNYGNQTVGENIADTMGLEAAFRAYQRRERECGKPNTVLPGQENLTNDQLFFLSFANLWCEDPAMSAVKAKRDIHSIGRLRVIGTVSNSQDFAKAYNCPVGSAMNPEKKCHIWK
ncbi:membrane metallo-endopeptidase-like 1 [Mycetomoellerius zeteki]|uniref:membrane metallo-endopeptidase-like 1 n=1 Tax=Mycetomoellerius zeteki TaxID=64791 RepID=UPI00084E68DA|nr:PREDICTED: membrane metallo-endopeptidase-like 1 [Trachymyrmex zeteki]